VSVAPDETSAWPCPLNPAHPFSPPSCMAHRRRVTETIGSWSHWRDLPRRTVPESDLWRRAEAAGYRIGFTHRLTAIKFPGSWRRDCYRTLPSHEQAAWFERIRTEPDLEVRLLMDFVVGTHVPTGLPYAQLLRNLFDQTVSRLRRRWSLRALWLGRRPRTHNDIAALRHYKGL
jgi:hypothetical protein